jgi:hypothetical protein
MSKIGPYEKKLKAHLKEKGYTLHVTTTPGADPETVAKELLEMETAFEHGEFKDVTNEPC